MGKRELGEPLGGRHWRERGMPEVTQVLCNHEHTQGSRLQLTNLPVLWDLVEDMSAGASWSST